ncbi:hypothetical protein ACFL2V_20940 [Pseudomonadota bacterium]
MKVSAIDWRYMRSALIVVVISVLVAALVVSASMHYYSNIEVEYSLKSSEHDDLQQMLADAREDETIIKDYLDGFRGLEQAGVFDKTQRVEWVDAVNNARSNMKLPLVRYHILPEAAFEADYLTNDGYVTITASQVKLEAGLLHEGDLDDLFSWMDRYAPGQLHVSECNMKRTGLVFGYYEDSSNLTVECQMLWLTIKPIDQQTGEAG